MRNFPDKSTENQNTHFMYSTFFFEKSWEKM